MNYWRQDSKGRWHRVIIQEFEYSCAMACCAMVTSAYKGRYIREQTFIQGKQGMLGYRPGAGTFDAANMSSLLDDQGVNNIYDRVGANALITQLEPHISPSRLAIVQVAWDAGGFHMVIVARIYPTDGLTIIVDPGWGRGLVEQNRSDFPDFEGMGRLTGSYVLAV